LLPGTLDAAARLGPSAAPPERPRLKLGLVTYNLARSWTLDQVIENCTQSKVEAVELRTTHAHGVEVTLSAERRKEIKRRFESSPVRLASLGSAFEFQSPDPAELRKNIEGAKEYARLAADVGAAGFKVRPNGFPPRGAVPEETTLRQIGQALAEVGTAAAAVGVEVRVEVHGNGTCRLPNIRKILDHAAHLERLRLLELERGGSPRRRPGVELRARPRQDPVRPPPRPLRGLPLPEALLPVARCELFGILLRRDPGKL
jgi:hypothetical protein